MRNLIVGLVIGASVSFGAYAKTNQELDLAASTFKWTGRKVSGEHTGGIKFKSGSVSLEKGVPVGGEFALDMATINDVDLDNAEWRTKLETHLKSPDFFNVEKFPTATFKVESAKAQGAAGEYEITGTLTVKDISKPVIFVAKVNEEKDLAKATAKFQINRLNWDIKYNSGKFFDVKKLGDKMIYDDIGIELSLVTKATAAPAKKS